uniref:SFRICE_040352 n=1 Tax=Spodoptera frugiperda TaxID=7108 RepID=A0A2H1WGU4_SPOFR
MVSGSVRFIAKKIQEKFKRKAGNQGISLAAKRSSPGLPVISKTARLVQWLGNWLPRNGAESPGKSTAPTGFQMAPGGERRKSTTDPVHKDSVDELQRRLDNLRGFNL